MYYILDCEPILNDKGEALTETHNCFRIANIRLWTNGSPIDLELKKNIPNPIEIDFEPLRGYKGPPRELKDLCIPIMSKRLSDALTSAGVDNIDYFPAILKNIKTGETYNYMAYKIIGLVSAADMDASEYETYDSNAVADTSFYELSIDESRTYGLKLFRLAENTSAIMVHESVKKYLEEAGINTLKFMKPDEWVQL